MERLITFRLFFTPRDLDVKGVALTQELMETVQVVSNLPLLYKFSKEYSDITTRYRKLSLEKLEKDIANYKSKNYYMLYIHNKLSKGYTRALEISLDLRRIRLDFNWQDFVIYIDKDQTIESFDKKVLIRVLKRWDSFLPLFYGYFFYSSDILTLDSEQMFIANSTTDNFRDEKILKWSDELHFYELHYNDLINYIPKLYHGNVLGPGHIKRAPILLDILKNGGPGYIEQFDSGNIYWEPEVSPEAVEVSRLLRLPNAPEIVFGPFFDRLKT